MATEGAGIEDSGEKPTLADSKSESSSGSSSKNDSDSWDMDSSEERMLKDPNSFKQGELNSEDDGVSSDEEDPLKLYYLQEEEEERRNREKEEEVGCSFGVLEARKQNLDYTRSDSVTEAGEAVEPKEVKLEDSAMKPKPDDDESSLWKGKDAPSIRRIKTTNPKSPYARFKPFRLQQKQNAPSSSRYHRKRRELVLQKSPATALPETKLLNPDEKEGNLVAAESPKNDQKEVAEELVLEKSPVDLVGDEPSKNPVITEWNETEVTQDFGVPPLNPAAHVWDDLANVEELLNPNEDGPPQNPQAWDDYVTVEELLNPKEDSGA